MPVTQCQSVGQVTVGTLDARGIRRVCAVPGERYLDGLYDSAIEAGVCR